MNEKKGAGSGADSQQAWVYFIESAGNGHIKIGFTKGEVEARRRALQTGSPETLRVLAQVRGDEKLERRLHARFATSRVVGEWFEPSDALLAYIDGIHLAQEQHITGFEARAKAEDSLKRLAREAAERMQAEREAKWAAREAAKDAARTPEERARRAKMTEAELLEEAKRELMAALNSSSSSDPFASGALARRRAG